MSSYFLTGTSRGLGLGLLRLLASKPTSEVQLIFASARTASNELKAAIESNPGRVYFIELEVTNAVAIMKAIEDVKIVLEEKGATLDVLINNAGILAHTPGGTEKM
jgi:NAD(P)-dependent dehydrogenase (short-subunit alcohol dehydrogenase family)